MLTLIERSIHTHTREKLIYDLIIHELDYFGFNWGVKSSSEYGPTGFTDFLGVYFQFTPKRFYVKFMLRRQIRYSHNCIIGDSYERLCFNVVNFIAVKVSVVVRVSTGNLAIIDIKNMNSQFI